MNYKSLFHRLLGYLTPEQTAALLDRIVECNGDVTIAQNGSLRKLQDIVLIVKLQAELKRLTDEM